MRKRERFGREAFPRGWRRWGQLAALGCAPALWACGPHNPTCPHRCLWLSVPSPPTSQHLPPPPGYSIPRTNCPDRFGGLFIDGNQTQKASASFPGLFPLPRVLGGSGHLPSFCPVGSFLARELGRGSEGLPGPRLQPSGAANRRARPWVGVSVWPLGLIFVLFCTSFSSNVLFTPPSQGLGIHCSFSLRLLTL